MPKIPLPIANGFYESDSLPISAQECVNWYPNIVQAPALSQETLFGTPGITQLATTGTKQQANRGSHVKNGIAYVVNGNALYRVNLIVDVDGNESFTTTSLGSITGTGRVSMADNGTQLMILVPGGDGFIFNEDAGTPFQQITDPDFTANGAPQIVVFVDGFFAANTDSKKWIESGLNDGLSWNALDFGTAESDPDKIVAPHVFKNQIFQTGSETTEGFQNIGGSGFTFVRTGLFLDKGCFAPFSLISANNTWMMIGGGINESPAVWQFTGNGFAKVSTTAIDAQLQKFSRTDIEDAFAFSYAQKGAYFVGFTVSDRTFVYDVISKRWHERKSVIQDVQERWRVNSLVTAYNRIIVADSVDGRIGSLETETFTEYGSNIIRTIATQPFANQGNSVRVPMIELTMESGVGNADVPNPQISMSYSDDGKVFKFERNRAIGKIGEFFRRCIWYKNGRIPRFRVFRFRLSDAVKPVIIKLEAKIS